MSDAVPAHETGPVTAGHTQPVRWYADGNREAWARRAAEAIAAATPGLRRTCLPMFC